MTLTLKPKKGNTTRNTHVKYDSITYHSKVMANFFVDKITDWAKSICHQSVDKV